MRVKICGITRPEDALVAEAAGADAIGMIFSASKRRVEREAAAEIVAAVGPFISLVGVFRNAPLAEVVETLDDLGLDVAQLHGAEGPDYAAAVARHARVLRAVSYESAPEPAAVAGYPAAAFLVDGPEPGSGQLYDWSVIAAWRAHPRLVLAGGLTAENVGEAISSLWPYAVDTASGVERSPGIKDHEAVRRFVANAKASRAS